MRGYSLALPLAEPVPGAHRGSSWVGTHHRRQVSRGDQRSACAEEKTNEHMVCSFSKSSKHDKTTPIDVKIAVYYTSTHFLTITDTFKSIKTFFCEKSIFNQITDFVLKISDRSGL